MHLPQHTLNNQEEMNSTFNACAGECLFTRHKLELFLEEGTSLEKMPPSDWPVGKPYLADD